MISVAIVALTVGKNSFSERIQFLSFPCTLCCVAQMNSLTSLRFREQVVYHWCRSTSAKPADRWSHQQKTFQVHQIRTRRHWNYIYGTDKPITLLIWNWSTFILLTRHNANILYLGYVVVLYPACIHTCISCRRYVVLTYRSIIIISWRKHLSDTCNSGELILIGIE